MDPSISQTPVGTADSRENQPPREPGRRNRRRGDRSQQHRRPDQPPDLDGERPLPPPPRPGAIRRRGRGMPSGPPPVRCVRSVVVVPDTWPVVSRGGIATAALIEVDRRGDERLVCDGLHAGPHFWPDVEPSPPIWDADLDASLANPDPEDQPDEAGQAPGTPVADLPIVGMEDDEA